MYSYVTKDKQVLDWKFEKIRYGYQASLGTKIKLGEIYNSKTSGWKAVSYFIPDQSVNGFKSRYIAMEHLIDLYEKYRMKNESH